MTLRDVITEKRREFWKDADAEQMGEELELIVERIDEMDDRISKIESEIINLLLRMDSVELAEKKRKSEVPGSWGHDFTGPGEDPED